MFCGSRDQSPYDYLLPFFTLFYLSIIYVGYATTVCCMLYVTVKERAKEKAKKGKGKQLNYTFDS